MPPTGGGGPPGPLSAVGGGIFREPELMCLYSVAILGVPWLNMKFEAEEREVSIMICRCYEVQKVEDLLYCDPATKWGI